MMKLKPCPFCGGEATVWNGNIDDDYPDVYYDVYCTACNCMTPKFHTKESAITFWNRREPIKVVEQIEAEIESSDKYISEYDDSEVQKAYNKGMRKCLEIVKGGAV